MINSVTKLEKYQDPIQKAAASMAADFLALVVTTPDCKYATISDEGSCTYSAGFGVAIISRATYLVDRNLRRERTKT